MNRHPHDDLGRVGGRVHDPSHDLPHDTPAAPGRILLRAGRHFAGCVVTTHRTRQSINAPRQHGTEPQGTATRTPNATRSATERPTIRPTTRERSWGLPDLPALLRQATRVRRVAGRRWRPAHWLARDLTDAPKVVGMLAPALAALPAAALRVVVGGEGWVWG